jgi:hypothetical protein
VLVIGTRRLTALDASDGAIRWSADPPAGCRFDPGWPAETARVIALGTEPEAISGSARTPVDGYDLSTGQTAWRQRSQLGERPIAASAHTIVELDSNTIIDARTGRQAGTLQPAGIGHAGAADHVADLGHTGAADDLVTGGSLYPPLRGSDAGTPAPDICCGAEPRPPGRSWRSVRTPSPTVSTYT